MLLLKYKAALLRRMIRHELAYQSLGMPSRVWIRNIRAGIAALAEAGF